MKSLAHPRDKDEILRRLNALRPESVRRWGRMSAHQMVCHVADALRVAAGQKPVSLMGGPLQRTVVKWIALWLPVRWPPGIRTSPEVDQEGQSCTRPGDFAADRAKIEALIEGVTGPTRRLEGRLHPIFGTMSERAWLRWGYLHLDHHLRQFGA
jgi:hypothetical protein